VAPESPEERIARVVVAEVRTDTRRIATLTERTARLLARTIGAMDARETERGAELREVRAELGRVADRLDALERATSPILGAAARHAEADTAARVAWLDARAAAGRALTRAARAVAAAVAALWRHVRAHPGRAVLTAATIAAALGRDGLATWLRALADILGATPP
jgi:ElaB/YqjD/DUF883 family membrane-anchored ribosome-binding protein